MASDYKHIIQSLAANVAIAVSKGVAASITGSGALLAETIHSVADCANQLLLLLGVWRSKKAPSQSHPLGYGRVLYFWSFMVALLLFAGGGVFSIYEGFYKIWHPEPLEGLWIGLATLMFAFVVEGWATVENLKEMRRRRGTVSLFRYLRDTKDSDLVVIFGENAAATLGVLAAMIAVVLAKITGNTQWDGAGSIVIGMILVGVSLFLAMEIQSLLVGERADPKVEAMCRELIPSHPRITRLLHAISVQQGPGQVLLLIKLGFQPGTTVEEVSDAINIFEADLRSKLPEVRWCFIEPDRPRN